MTASAYPTLPLSRYIEELRRETGRLAVAARGVPVSVPVPTCPGWTLADLIRHVRQGHDWARTILAARSTELILPGEAPGAAGDGRSWSERVARLGVRKTAEEPHIVDPDLRERWLAEGADLLVEAIDGVGLDVPVWAPHGKQNKEFWPRWAMFETAVHRADVCLLAGLPFELDTAVALDAVDFCVGAFGAPSARPFHSPLFAEIPRGGETLRFRSAPAGGGRDWLITCAPDGVRVTRDDPAAGDADAAVVAAPSDLLLVVKGRLRPESPRMTVTGDRDLLDFWLSHAIS